MRHGEVAAATGRWRFRTWRGGLLVAERVYTNKLCNRGLGVLMGFLNGEYTSPTPVYGAVGNGASVTPASTDTTLVAELARVALSSNSRSGTQVTFDFFFNTNQGNPGGAGTLTEAGVFLQATASVNAGSLLSHVAITQTKNSTETMTVEFAFTIVSNT